MKSMITLAAVLLASSVSFAAKCPAGTETIKSCKSTPQAGDNEVAGNIFASISICQSGSKTLMAVKSEDNTVVSDADVTVRAGGTSYVVKADEEGVSFSLNVTTGVRPGSPKTASFTISFVEGGYTGSSTYTCKK